MNIPQYLATTLVRDTNIAPGQAQNTLFKTSQERPLPSNELDKKKIKVYQPEGPFSKLPEDLWLRILSKKSLYFDRIYSLRNNFIYEIQTVSKSWFNYFGKLRLVLLDENIIGLGNLPNIFRGVDYALNYLDTPLRNSSTLFGQALRTLDLKDYNNYKRNPSVQLWQNLIEKCPNLYKLVLPSGQIDQVISIHRLRNIRHMNLGLSAIREISFLQIFTNLLSLNLNNCSTQLEIPSFQKCEFLKKFTFKRYYDLHEPKIDQLNNKNIFPDSIEVLNLEVGKLLDLREYGSLQNLHSISLTTEQHPPSIDHLTSLKRLSVKMENRGLSINYLSTAPQITKLEFQLRHGNIPNMNNLINLNELYIQASPYNEKSKYISLSLLTNLKKLTLRQTLPTPCYDIPSLEELNLMECQVTSNRLTTLTNLTKLSLINLFNCSHYPPYVNSSIDEISFLGLTNITNLSIHCDRLKKICISTLKQLTYCDINCLKLEKFCLPDSQIISYFVNGWLYDTLKAKGLEDIKKNW